MLWVGGAAQPVHATSAGGVSLAHLPSDQLDAVLAEDLQRCTPHTVINLVVPSEQLGLVRDRGSASTREEQERGLAAIATPIRCLDGGVVAGDGSPSCVGPSSPGRRTQAALVPGRPALGRSTGADGRVRRRSGGR